MIQRAAARARQHIPRRQDATVVCRFAHAERSRRPLRADAADIFFFGLVNNNNVDKTSFYSSKMNRIKIL